MRLKYRLGFFLDKILNFFFSKSALYSILNKKFQKNLLSNNKLIIFAVLILHRGIIIRV